MDQPWERREDETEFQYDRFKRWLLTEPRPVPQVFAKMEKVSPTAISRSVIRFDWRGRARAYDNWITGEAIEALKDSHKQEMLEEFEAVRRVRKKVLAKIEAGIDADEGGIRDYDSLWKTAFGRESQLEARLGVVERQEQSEGVLERLLEALGGQN